MACALYLFVRRAASPGVFLSYLAVCALFAALFPRVSASVPYSVALELCSGYLLFAGVFLLGDPVTAPRFWLARIAYGALAGLLVMLLRHFGRFEDAPCFAVLLVNSVSGLLDRGSWRVVYRFAGRRAAKGGEGS
jgi:electron transport complex protein RnfD